MQPITFVARITPRTRGHGRWHAALAMLLALAGILLAPSSRAQDRPGFAPVAALLQQRCVMCHSGPQAAAGLRLDSHAGLMAGSSRGPVVQPGRAGDSELIRRVRGESLPRMPMTGPPWLSEAEVSLLVNWVAAGAPGTGTAPTAAATGPVPLGPEEIPTWQHVAPILAQRCVKCHAAQGLMGPAPEGYRLGSHADTLDASDRARVVPGRPEASELVRRIRGQARPRMPLDGPPYLDDAEIDRIVRWVQGGARDAEGRPTPIPVGARVRLHGTLRSPLNLDDLPLELFGARLDKKLSLGGPAQVRGTLGPQGEVRVERLRGR